MRIAFVEPERERFSSLVIPPALGQNHPRCKTTPGANVELEQPIAHWAELGGTA